MNEPYQGQDEWATMRSEWRTERRALEHDALHDAWTRRTVSDVLHESLRRGDELRIAAYRRVFNGHLVDAGADFAKLQTHRKEQVAIRTMDQQDPYNGPPILIEVLAQAQITGGDPTDQDATFRSLLQQCDAHSQLDPRARIELGVALQDDPLTGQLNALGVDHLYVNTEQYRATIPLSQVIYIAWSRPPARNRVQQPCSKNFTR